MPMRASYRLTRSPIRVAASRQVSFARSAEPENRRQKGRCRRSWTQRYVVCMSLSKRRRDVSKDKGERGAENSSTHKTQGIWLRIPVGPS